MGAWIFCVKSCSTVTVWSWGCLKLGISGFDKGCVPLWIGSYGENMCCLRQVSYYLQGWPVSFHSLITCNVRCASQKYDVLLLSFGNEMGHDVFPGALYKARCRSSVCACRRKASCTYPDLVVVLWSFVLNGLTVSLLPHILQNTLIVTFISTKIMCQLKSVVHF